MPGNNTVVSDQISVCRRYQQFVERAVGELRVPLLALPTRSDGIESDSLSLPEHPNSSDVRSPGPASPCFPDLNRQTDKRASETVTRDLTLKKTTLYNTMANSSCR